MKPADRAEADRKLMALEVATVFFFSVAMLIIVAFLIGGIIWIGAHILDALLSIF